MIDSLDGIKDLRAYLEPFEYVTYDTETTGLTRNAQVIGFSVCCAADRAYYVILAEWDLEKIVIKPYLEEAKSLIRYLQTKSLIGHNFTFDAMITDAYLKIKLIDSLHTDTLILAHLLDENRPVGLKPLGAAYFGGDAGEEQKLMKDSVTERGGKLTKHCFELYKADPYLIGKYGAKDAWLTYMLFTELVPELYEQGLDKFFYEDESMPLLKGPTYDMNTVGLQIDTQELVRLKKQLQAEILEDKTFIMDEIAAHIKDKYPCTNKKNTFNLGSNAQLSWLMFGKLELEFGTLTKSGKEIAKALGQRLPYTFPAKREFIHSCNERIGEVYEQAAVVNEKKKNAKKIKEPWGYIMVDKKTLAKYSQRLAWVKRLLEMKKREKILGTYVEGIEERLDYGIIQPSFLQHGTTSGRYSSRSPNFQNLPRDDKRVKALVVPRPGKVFVGADQSQLEPRTFAYYSADERLMAAFDGTSDFYSIVGMDVYDKTDCTPQKEGSPDAFGVKYKKLRDLSKVIALASAYGATAHQLAPTTGKSIDATQADIDSYFDKFPGVRKMIDDAHSLAKKQGYVESLYGRKRRIPDAAKIGKLYGETTSHGDLPYEARNLLNLAVNHRIQSTGASIVNRGAIRFHNLAKEAEINCSTVLQVHDQLVIECDEKDSENVALLLREAMENTVQLEGIRFESVPRIGKSLAEV